MIDVRERARKNVSGTCNGKANVVNSIRERRKTNRTTGTNRVKKTYKPDCNGCEHDNPDFWQPASKEYSNATWRKKNKCHLSLKCSNCNEPV